MKQVTVVVPGSLAMRTGGSIYDRHIVQGLKARGWSVTVIELDPVLHPLAPPLETALPRFASIPDGSLVLIDGLAFGTMPEAIEREGWRLRFVPIVHMPLSATPGLTRGDAAWLSSLERRSLRYARHIVITGQRIRTQVQALSGSSDPSFITRVAPGAARVVREPGEPAERRTVRLLCVANLTPGKGHDILLRGLASLGDAEWTLMCSGSDSRDPATAAYLRSLAGELGVSRVAWRGESDETSLGAVYAAADLFVLATRGETYGMAVAEAISYGVPVISTRTGEIPTIVGEGGLLAEPGDVEGFSALLAQGVADAVLRKKLREGARAAAQRLPMWDDSVDAMAAVLTKVAASG